jgi:excisionase family DNA binding protein
MPKQAKSTGVRVTMKVPEAARIAGCGERAIRNGIEEGTIPHLKFGRNIVIPRSTFLAWLESAAVQATNDAK